MKLAVALVANVLLVSLFLRWLRAEYRQAGPLLRHWLLPALAWRLVFTAISSVRPNLDIVGPAKWGRWLADYGLAHPWQFFQMLQGARFAAHGETVGFYQWSNTLFFYKLFAWLGLASGGIFQLSGLYLSVLCFIGCWTLVRTLRQVFPATPLAAGGIAFLLWPTVVWWTAGLTKETVLIGAEAGLVAVVLPLIYSHRRWQPVALLGRVVLGLLLAWVALRMRIFFALPLLGGLVALAAVGWATRQKYLSKNRLVQVGSLLLLVALGGSAALAIGGSQVLAYFSREVDANYKHGLATSVGRPHLEYANWQTTPAGLARHAPLAAEQALVRPWLGESGQPLYVGAGLENAMLLSLFALALVALVRGRPGQLPVAIVVLLAGYCLLLAAFIGLSTPNLGTLHRYRAALLPWLLWLLLQNDYARQVLRRFRLE